MRGGIEIVRRKKGCGCTSCVIVILIFIAVGIFFLIMVKGQFENNKEYETIEEVPKHKYNWDFLSEKNGVKNYIEKNGREALIGIDVSAHQGDINWSKVKEFGIDFAIIRVGYRGYENGKIVLDDKFKYNIENAIKENIEVGVYFFSQAINEKEAIEEAEFVIKNIKGYKIQGPVVFDLEELGNIESRIDDLNKRTRSNIAISFCETIKKARYKAMIYASRNHFTSKYNFNEIAKYKLWLADYNERPNFDYEFQVWQYTDEGSIDGIKHNVDFNIMFK